MKIVIDSNYQHLHSTIASLPSLIRAGRCDIVYDKRNLVARFVADGLPLMVKRYKRVNIVQQVVYTFFRRTKAERAYAFATEFLRRGISTPLPVAYIEESSCGLFAVGYFISSEAKGTETHLLLREVADYPPQLAEAVARQVVMMHSQGVMHGDLNLSNFLCTDDADGYHFTMIDTNRSHFCDGFPSDNDCLRNMVRLTHRRDLYEDLIRRYARIRQWDEDATARKAIAMLDRFEH